MSENQDEAIRQANNDIQKLLAGEGGDSDKDVIADSLSKSVDELSNERNLSFFSHLTPEQIRQIAVLESLNHPVIDTMVASFKRNAVSKRRKGRREIIDVVRALGNIGNDREDGEDVDEGLLKRLM